MLLLTALLLTYCGSPPPPPPPPAPPLLTLTIKAGPDQNPDSSGHPTPVAIRLFLLNGTAKFERADVFALSERERATLGDDTAGSEEFVVRPGETRMIEREPKKGVQFLGVAVMFRDIDQATWRAIAPIAASGRTRLVLTTGGLKTTLAPA